MPIEEECDVVKVNGKRAVIELIRKPECNGCKACAFNRRNKLKMTAVCEIDCKAGSRVVIRMPEKVVQGSWLVLFAIPIVLMLIAVLITSAMQWYVQIAAVGSALLIGLAAIVLCDRIIRRKPQYLPTVLREVTENNSNNIGVAND